MLLPLILYLKRLLSVCLTMEIKAIGAQKFTYLCNRFWGNVFKYPKMYLRKSEFLVYRRVLYLSFAKND